MKLAYSGAVYHTALQVAYNAGGLLLSCPACEAGHSVILDAALGEPSDPSWCRGWVEYILEQT